MRTQLVYELRTHRNARMILLLGALLIHALLLISFPTMGAGSFSVAFPIIIGGLVLGALCVYAVIQTILVFVRMYKTPQSYMTFLPPVRASTLLLSRALAVLIDTIVPFAIGLGGLLLQISARGIMNWELLTLSPTSNILFGIVLSLLAYLLLLATLFFAFTFVKSYLPYVKGRVLIGLLLVFAVTGIANYPALLLGLIRPAGISFYPLTAIVALPQGFNPLSIAYMFLIALETFALYFFTCKMMDKKLNL